MTWFTCATKKTLNCKKIKNREHPCETPFKRMLCRSIAPSSEVLNGKEKCSSPSLPHQTPSTWWETSIPQRSQWRQWSFRGQAHDQSLLDDHRQPSSSCRPWRVSSLSERRDESKVRILIERIVNWNWGPTRGIKIMLPDLVVPQSLNRTSLLNICYLPWMINQNCCIWIFLSKLWLTRLPLGVVFFLFLLLGRLFLQLSLELVDLKRQEWKRLENYCTQKRWK